MHSDLGARVAAQNGSVVYQERFGVMTRGSYGGANSRKPLIKFRSRFFNLFFDFSTALRRDVVILKSLLSFFENFV
jgi:hypothetical protein